MASSAVLGTLAVRLTALTAGFDKQLKNAEGRAQKFSRAMAKISAVSAIGFGAATAALMKYTKAASVQREAELRLASAIQATGQAIDAEKIKAYASALQKVTTFGDEATIEGAALLTTFDLTEKSILKLMPVMQNFATVMRTDLKTSALTLGRALTMGASALTRYGIKMNEVQAAAFNAAKGHEKVNLLVDIMNRKTGPAAEAVAKTASGAMDQFANAAGDVSEQLGFLVDQPVAKKFRGFTKAAERLGDFIDKLNPKTKELIADVAMVGTAVAGTTAVVAAFGAVIATLKFSGILAGMTKLAAAFKALTLAAAPFLAIAASLTTAFGAVRLIMGDTEETSRKLGFEAGDSFADKFLKGAKASFSEGLGTIIDPVTSGLSAAVDGLINKMKSKGFDFTGQDLGVALTIEDALPGGAKKGFDFSGVDLFEDTDLSELNDNLAKHAEAILAAQKAAFIRQAEVRRARERFVTDPVSRAVSRNAPAVAGIANAISTSGGDPMLAAARIGAQLLASSDGFQKALSLLERPIKTAAKLFDDLIGPLLPLVSAIADLADSILGLVGKLTKGVGGLLDKGAGFLESGVRKLGGLFGSDGDESSGYIRDFIDRIKEGAEAMGELNDQLVNTPEGFKIAFRRFEATTGEEIAETVGGPSALGPGQAMAGGFVVENVNITAQEGDTLESLADEARARAQFGDFASETERRANISPGFVGGGQRRALLPPGLPGLR